MKWKQSKPNVFWGEIAPRTHVAQFYKDEASFIDVLTNFVGAGINAGDSVIVIATPDHLQALDQRLLAHGIYLPTLLTEHQYIPIVAEDMLEKFMRNELPDHSLFEQEIEKLFQLAGKYGQQIRAFGEMVALLLAEGNKAAMIELEILWNRVCQKHLIRLFCAYPINLVKDDQKLFANICSCHNKLIVTTNGNNEIEYANTIADDSRKNFKS